MTSNVREQLAVFHDPFNRATKQPKIPDGKVSESLGLSSQLVGSITNSVSQRTMHLLLFPGQGVCVCSVNDSAAAFGRNFRVFGFVGGGGPNWNGWVDDTSADITQTEQLALWRVVSQGLQLKLMNVADEDDGWWESVRVNEPFDNDDYIMTTSDNSPSKFTSGCCAPIGLLGQMVTRNLAMENTYSTGLLRDLQNVQFNLHGKMDHHDFSPQKETIRPPDVDPGGFDAALINLHMTDNDEFTDVINQYVDPGYDAVYIRLHCRQNEAMLGQTGSTFHMNCIQNTEQNYGNAQFESRYQTGSENIGSAQESHNGLRNMSSSSAHQINA